MSGLTISPIGGNGATLLLDGLAIDQLLTSEQGPVGIWLTDIGQQLQTRAKARIRPSRVTTRTGLGLRDSIVKRMGRDSQGLVLTVAGATNYSYFVHEGTEPHRIAPNRRNALYFYSVKAGRFIMVRKAYDPGTGRARSGAYIDSRGVLVTNKGYVDHPGTKPNRFLTEPLQQILST